MSKLGSKNVANSHYYKEPVSKDNGKPLPREEKIRVEPVILFCVCVSFFCLFAFSRAAPTAYGGSQARGRIGAVATGLCQSHSNAGSDLRL